MNTPLFIAYAVASVGVVVMAAIRIYNGKYHRENAARDRKHAEQEARRRQRMHEHGVLVLR